jgi:LysM repeat protein
MADMVTDSGTKEANEKAPKKNKNTKYYLVGGLAVVALLVFVFVKKSNSNSAASTTGAASTGYGATAANSLLSSILPYLESGGSATTENTTTMTNLVTKTNSITKTNTVNKTKTITKTNTVTKTKIPLPPPSSTAHNPSPPLKTTYSTYVVKAGQSLTEIANMFGISVATLAHANVYVAGELPGNAKVGQTLGTGAGLKTGQVLKIPHVAKT